MNNIKQMEILRKLLIKQGAIGIVYSEDNAEAEGLLEDLELIKTETFVVQDDFKSTEFMDINYRSLSVFDPVIGEVEAHIKQLYPFSIVGLNDIKTHMINFKNENNSYTYKLTVDLDFYESDLIDMEEIKQIYEIKETLLEKNIEWLSLAAPVEHAIDLYYRWQDDEPAVPFYLWYALHYGG